ncbi:MAG: T9SS type A sorting domain-containing protein [Bacteroidales bacterium]|nr:T9SS type A sorting domain-containing protein [Bacteroidales bacterium]
MKKTLLIMLCFLTGAGIPTVKAQYVPNGGFEEWETRVLYQEPENWTSGNMEALMYNTLTAIKTEDSYRGDYALRLESAITETDTVFGYATCNGMVTNGESPVMEFTGGIPVSGTPDSLFGYFKFNVAEDDTAIVLLSFKEGGNPIAQNIFPITGTQSSYIRMGWQVAAPAGTPDTAFIGITSTNPYNPVSGSWVQVDSLWFGVIDDSIPNCDFEVWENEAYFEPADHLTANLLTHFFGGDTSAKPIPDAHSGDYAISIKAVETSIPGDEGMTDVVASFLMPYATEMIFGDEISTFPVDFNPSRLTGFYKFTPAANDTAIAYVILRDEEENEYENGTILLTASEYTPFSVNLFYPPGTTITEVGYVFSTTLYFGIGDGGSGEVGSELILDDLDLINPCDEFDEFTIDFTEATCETLYSILDAGEGWDEYLWSTDETTQTITTTEPGTFSVTVTDNATGCQFSDEVIVNIPLCDNISRVIQKKSSTSIYPNPSNGNFTVELENMLPGGYTIEIVSITGKTLKKHTAQSTNARHKIQFDLTGYPQGLYLVKIEGNKYSHYERILIE